MKGVILSAAKNLLSEGQMLHFVQHDNPSNNLRQNTTPRQTFEGRQVAGLNITTKHFCGITACDEACPTKSCIVVRISYCEKWILCYGGKKVESAAAPSARSNMETLADWRHIPVVPSSALSADRAVF
jgi:hypothetical protein